MSAPLLSADRRDGAPLRRPARRGTLYVCVLGTVLLVTVIGLTGLLAARVALRSGRLAEAAARADAYAQSALDLALYAMALNPAWRSTYTHNKWTTAVTDGDVSFCFKLCDEADGNLVNDASQPVRAYGRASTGGIARIYSVLLEPRAPTNLLVNGGMEDGTTGWSGALCQIESRTDGPPRSGTRCLYALNKTSTAGGPTQTLAGALKNGATYQIEVWVKMDSGTGNARATLEIISVPGGTQSFTGGTTSVTTAWTRVVQTVTPTWSGSLTSASLRISTGDWTAFRIDDAALTEQRSPMLPVAGTWRREVLATAGADEEEELLKGKS